MNINIGKAFSPCVKGKYVSTMPSKTKSQNLQNYTPILTVQMISANAAIDVSATNYKLTAGTDSVEPFRF